MTTAYLPVPVFRAFTSAGLPLAGGLLYTYAAGTTTPQTTYGADGTTSNANPVVLDSSGTATIRLQDLSYKFVLKDSGGATQWTVDNYVQGVGTSPTFSGTVTAGTLSVTGNATVTGNLTVSSNAIVSGSLSAASGNLTNLTLIPTTVSRGLAVNSNGVHSTVIADVGNISYNAGYLELPVINYATPYTATLQDSGKCLYYNGTGAAAFTIPANTGVGSVAYPVGTTLTFVNDATGATNMTIAITTDTLVFAGTGATGSRTLAQYGRATAHKLTSTRWYIGGTGLS